MAVAFVRNHTAITPIKAAGTTIGLNISTIVPVGNALIAHIVFDNAATASKPIVSSIAKAAGETNSWALLGAARSTSTTAGAFASAEMWVIQTTVAWPVAAYTVTLDTSTVMKATQAQEFSGLLATQRSTAGTAYSTTTTAASAATTGTTPVIGDLAIGLMFQSNAASFGTTDTDVLGGAWTGAVGVGSTGSTAATNNFGQAQYKILTAASHQTLNAAAALTAGNGSIVAVLQQIPAVAPTARTISAAAGTPAATAVNLTWADDTAAYPDPTYLIERSANGTTGWTTVATGQVGQTSYNVTALTPATTYYFRITGTNSAGSTTSNVAGPITTASLPGVATFTDDFATAVDKVTKWPNSTAGPVWDSSGGGRCKIPNTSSYDSLNTLQTTSAPYSLTGSSLFAQVTPPPVGNGTRDTTLTIQGVDALNQELTFWFSAGTLNARYAIGGVKTTIRGNVTYDPVNHAWLRIRESSGTIYFDTSADSTTWANFTSVATSTITWSLNQVSVSLGAGYYGTETAADSYFDNINNAVSATDIAFDTTTIPTWHTGNGTSTASTSVTLPAGKVILVAVLSDGDASPTQTGSVSTSGAALTWTKVVERNKATAGASYSAYAGIFRTVGDGTAHVITATIAYAKPITCMAVICDNVDTTTPTGAVGNAETALQDASIATYTSTVAKSRGFGCAMDWNNGPAATSTDQYTAVVVTGTGDGLYIRKSAVTATVGTTVSFNVKQTLTPNWQVVSVEMLPTGVVAAGGRPKVYVASAFTKKPMKVWTGAAWVEKPVKVWTGSTWKTLT